jgi:hypothetical protein
MDGIKWIHLAQDVNKWTLIKIVTTFKCHNMNCLTRCASISFSGQTLLHGVSQFQSTKKIISNGVPKLLENDDTCFKNCRDRTKANMRRKYSGVEDRFLQTYKRAFLYYVHGIHY